MFKFHAEHLSRFAIFNFNLTKPRDKTTELNCLMKLCPNSILNKRTHFESLWCNMQPGSASRSASSAFVNMLFKVSTKQAWLIKATPQKSWMIRYFNTWYLFWFMTMHMFILKDYLIAALLKCRPIVWYIDVYWYNYSGSILHICAHAITCRGLSHLIIWWPWLPVKYDVHDRLPAKEIILSLVVCVLRHL